MKTLQYFLITAALFLGTAGFAQDTIYYRSGEVKLGKVVEIGLDEIKYHNPGMETPVMTVDKNDLRKVVMSDGTILRFEEDPLDLAPTAKGLKKTRAIKLEFFAPLTNDFAFCFEHLIKKGMSMEYKLGIVGVGVGADPEEASGLWVKTGIKFFNSPEYYKRGMKRSHPLRGGYIKPEIILSRFTVRETYYSNSGGWFSSTPQIKYTKNVDYTSYAVNLVFGKQSVLAEAMTLDYYIGFGYGGVDGEEDADPLFDFSNRTYFYSHSFMGENFPMSVTCGVTLGVLF
jgi:hypothetical protein